MGVTVTSLIGLSAVTVGSVLTSRYAKSESYFQSVQTARSAMTKIQSQFRGAQLVTQVSPTQVSVWRDLNGDGQVNPSEMVLLTCSGGTIRQYQIVYPVGMSAATKLILDASTSLSIAVEQPASTASTIQNGPYSTSKVVAANVAEFSVSADASPPMSRMVTISVTSGQGSDAVTIRSVAALRGDKTGRVAVVEGHYALAGS